jgi:hypothetical protein
MFVVGEQYSVARVYTKIMSKYQPNFDSSASFFSLLMGNQTSNLYTHFIKLELEFEFLRSVVIGTKEGSRLGYLRDINGLVSSSIIKDIYTQVIISSTNNKCVEILKEGKSPRDV